MAPGDEVTVAGLEVGRGGGYQFAADATFDGGVRMVRGLRVGGAGATLWQLCIDTGVMKLVAAACMALPGVEDSQVAEAWGAHLAMSLVLRLRRVVRRVRIFGDNLGVVRFCGAQGRLHRTCAQSVLEPGLTQLALAGWHVSWGAVRRRLNMAADAEATEGIFWARRLRDEGGAAPRTRVRWFASSGGDQHG
jgi:hypothetical protein